jgi:hypothetical protein
MVMHVKRVLIVAASVILCAMLVSNASAFPPAAWEDGDEVDVFVHSFDEEYWTNLHLGHDTDTKRCHTD